MTDLDPFSVPGDTHGRPARVILRSDGILSGEDEQLLLAVISQTGIRARMEAISARLGDPTALTWIVLAILPLQAFLSGLGSKADDDSYARLDALLKRLTAAWRTHSGKAAAVQASASSPKPLILHDSSTGLEIVLEADLPLDTYSQLMTLDLSQFAIDPVHYDQAKGRWRSELDEAAANPSPPARAPRAYLSGQCKSSQGQGHDPLAGPHGE